MPIPQKKKNEKQGDYMGRCMEFMKDEKYPQKQKVAICLNTYSNPKKKSSANTLEIDFTEQILKMKEQKMQEEAKKQENAIQPQPVVQQVAQPVTTPTHNAVTAPEQAVVDSTKNIPENKTEEIKN
jgi:hypothetical protein